MTPGSADASHAATSEDTLRFLLSSEAHGPGAGAIELIETHMSWVVLDAREVWKLKKPVEYAPWFDLRTLAARERDSRAELRVNRRFAPEVYLGLLAVLRDGGRWSLLDESALPAPGRIVDWVVRMRRLPADRMLDRMIVDGQVLPQHVEALAHALAGVYRDAPPLALDSESVVRRLKREQERNREVLADPRFGLDQAAPVLDRFDRMLECDAPLLRQRVRQGRIVDGHGDLRPEHVCLLEPPLLIDALAFADELRQVDAFEELIALAFECELLGAAWVGEQLIEYCARLLDDQPDPALLRLYRASRALLRARLAVAHLYDPSPRRPERWLPLGQRCIAAAFADA